MPESLCCHCNWLCGFAPFVIANEQSERGNPFLYTPFVIAKVRVSGGHLCKAEAPTEPAGEICKRLWQSVSLSRGIRILSRFAFRMTHRLVIANTYGVRLYFRLPVIAIDFTAFAPSSLRASKASVAIRLPRGNPFPAPLHNGFSLPYNK